MCNLRVAWPRVLVLTAWFALCAFALVRLVVATYDMSALDLAVYRQAGLDLLHGASPYATRDALPFTYPPFAALVAMSLALLPAPAAWAVFAVVNMVCVAVCAWILARRAGSRISLCWLIPGFVALSPVWRTFELGQVNLVLMAMVLVDVFVVPVRHRGWLVGIAAGVKLVPAIFVLYFLARREYRAAAQAAAGAALTVIGAAIVLPRESATYWFELLRDPARIGHLEYIDNVSITGALARLPLELPSVLPLALGAGVVVLAAALSRQLSDRGDQLGALLAVAGAGLSASPVTWSHHWVWAAPLLAWAVQRGDSLVAIGTGLLMVATPMEWALMVPGRTWQVLGGFEFVALAVLFGFRARRELEPRLRWAEPLDDPLIVDVATPSPR